MSSIIREKWIWIIIGASIGVGVLPWILIFLILMMPGILAAIAAWIFIFSWAVLAGYKDWLVDRRKREKLMNSAG